MNAPNRTGRRAAFSSFGSPGYPILWWGGLFSFMSVQMQFLLRGILAWELTEREGALGLAYLCFGISLLIATPLGGVASDRLSKRAVLVVSQAVIMSAAVGMGIAVITGVVEFWMLLLAAVAQGGAFGFFGPARIAIASDIVGRHQIGNAIALSLLSMNGTRVFAPAIAGVLAGVAVIGIGGAYVISGACSLLSFAFLLRLPRTPNRVGPGAGRARPLAEIRAGVAYVAARRSLRLLVVSSFVVIMFGFNYVAFLPALIEGEFGLSDSWVGLASSASAFGAVAVSLPLAARADSPWAKAAMTIGGFAFGMTVVALGAAPTFWVAFAIICVVGASTTVFQTLSSTLALAMSDDEHQGRVQSLLQLSFAGFGIAALPLGALAEAIGLRPTIMGMGAVVAIAITAYLMAEGGWRTVRPPPRTGHTATVEGDVDLARSPVAGS
ncbi:MAG: MFS transporter [Acidimicrobiales bacterium]